MKTLTFSLAALAALALFVPAIAAAPLLQTGESVGSLPADPPAAPPKAVIKKGQSHTNSDGVKVTADADSKGKATLDPKDGDENSESTADTSTGFKGSVDNIDANDTVDVGSSNTLTITGNGGTILIAGGCNLRIKNGPHAPPMIVKLPDGTTITVEAGSTVTVGEAPPPEREAPSTPPSSTSNEPAVQSPPSARVSEHAEQVAA